MRNIGKKIGHFQTSTVLGIYDLDVYFDVKNSQFTVLVPTAPEAPVVKHDPKTWEHFSAKSLDDIKTRIAAFLRERDTTEFVDVIEYPIGDATWCGDERYSVHFDFRVARVSVAGGARPKLEKCIALDDAGSITEACDSTGQPYHPGAHHWKFDGRMPFTVERWRKCVAIRDGIAALKKKLTELFKGEDAAARLDRLKVIPPRLSPKEPDAEG